MQHQQHLQHQQRLRHPATVYRSTGTITVTAPAPAAGITYTSMALLIPIPREYLIDVAPGNYNVTAEDGQPVSRLPYK